MENVEIPVERKRVILKNKIKKNYSLASQAIIYQFLIMNLVVGAVVGIGSIFSSFKATKAALESGAEIDISSVTSSTTALTLIATALAGIIADSLTIFIIWKLSKIGSPKLWLKKPEINPIYIVLGCFAVLGTSLFDTTIMGLFGGIFSDTSDALNSALSFDTSNLGSFIPLCIYVCLVGPVLEELLCRGLILNLCSQVNRTFGIFMSAMLFGLMHMNIIQGINAFVMGLILAYVASKSRSIVPSIIIHIFNNTMAVVLDVIMSFVPENKQELFSNVSTYGLIVIGLICLAILLIKNKKLNPEDQVPAHASVRPELLEELTISQKEVTGKSFFSCISFYIVIVLFIANAISLILLPKLMEVMQNMPAQ